MHGNRCFLFFVLGMVVALSSLSSWGVQAKEEGALRVFGGGGGAVRQLLLDWSYSYRISYANLRLDYFRNSSLAAVLPLLQNKSLDFVSSDLALSGAQRKEYPSVAQFPLLVLPVVVHYNIPGLPVFVTGEDDRLILTVELLADIYLGAITNWRDPRILKQNPKLAHLLPNREITPVAFAGAATSNLFVTTTFYRRSKRYRSMFAGPIQAWPSNFTAVNPRLITRPGSFGTIVGVQSTPYSLGYATLPTWSLGQGGTLPYALFKGRNNQTLYPDSSLDFLKDATIDEKTGEVITKKAHLDEGWPFAGVSSLLLNKDFGSASSKTCEKQQELARFFRWTLVDKDARTLADNKGFLLLPQRFRDYSVDKLGELECDTEGLLEIQIKNNHDGFYFEMLLIISMVLCALLLLPSFVFFVLLSPIQGKKGLFIAKLYNSIFLLGALILYLSIIFFYLVPDETWICQLRQWLSGFGGAVFLGALFTRTLQIHRIYRLSRSKKLPTNHTASEMRRRGILDFIWGIGLSLLGQVIILILWSSTDTLEARLSTIDDIERTAAWVCKSDNTWLWIGLEIGFFICLMCYGLMVVYRTWDLKSKFTESKWLLMAIYNLLLTLAALVPLFATIEIQDDKLYFIVVAGLNFVVASTILALYLQRSGQWLERLIWKWRSSESATPGSRASSPSTIASSTDRGDLESSASSS